MGADEYALTKLVTRIVRLVVYIVETLGVKRESVIFETVYGEAAVRLILGVSKTSTSSPKLKVNASTTVISTSDIDVINGTIREFPFMSNTEFILF